MLVWQRNQILVLKEQVKVLMTLVEARTSTDPAIQTEKESAKNVGVDRDVTLSQR